MVKIQGHTVGSDGVVYDPGSASWGYVGELDSRNSEETRQEYAAASQADPNAVVASGLVGPAAPNPVAAQQRKTGEAGGGSGPGSGSIVVRAGGRTSQLSFGEPLKPKLQPTVTQVKVGGDWWLPNPWFSDADQWTQRYGEGEISETLFLVITAGADASYNTWRLADAIATPIENTWNGAQAQARGKLTKADRASWDSGGAYGN